MKNYEIICLLNIETKTKTFVWRHIAGTKKISKRQRHYLDEMCRNMTEEARY